MEDRKGLPDYVGGVFSDQLGIVPSLPNETKERAYDHDHVFGMARTGLGNGNIGHSRLDTRRREACGYRTNKVLSTAGHKFEPGFVALIQPLTLHRYDAYLCPAVLSGLVFGMPGILRQRRTCHLWQ